jgi:multidrug efflux pump subunit AcrA (membrane-fusion protein)
MSNRDAPESSSRAPRVSGNLQHSMSDEGEAADKSRGSDLPVNLLKEREAFVRSFLRKGVEYTELLLRENQDIRRELSLLRAENARLRAQVASDDAIRELLRTIEGLEAERNQLVERSMHLEQSRQRIDERQAEIEQEVNDLANLYIAAVQLHAGLSVRRVVRHVRDMCGQLVGALGFAIYIVDEGKELAHPIAAEAIDDIELSPIPLGSGPIGDACMTGIPRIREARGEALANGTLADPVAIIPMMVDGQPIGAVVILSMLGQKDAWASVDRELFQLIGNQAGVALIAANLYSPSMGPYFALRGLREKL